MQKFISIFILLFAFAGIFFSSVKLDIEKKPKAPMPDGHLADALPANIGKFSSKDLALGNTEEIARSAEKVLSLNEFLNRSYTDSSGREFTVYISYWGEGKESTAQASCHTPDRCWVVSGWKNINEKKQNGEILKVNGKDLMPAYYREMTFETANKLKLSRNIWFWFIVNGERYDYKTSDNMTPSIIKYVENTMIDAFMISPECYFVRIDSSFDLRELAQDPDFQVILESLGNLILYPKDKDNEL